MKYFDPARPRLANGTLRYLSEGRECGALGGLYLELLDESTIAVSTWLATEGGFRRHEASFELGLLPTLVLELLENPEAFFKFRLAWEPPLGREARPLDEKAPASQAASRSADELGL